MELPRLVSWMIQVGSRATESRSSVWTLDRDRDDRSRVESHRVETIVSPHQVDRRRDVMSLMVRGADDSRVVNLESHRVELDETTAPFLLVRRS